MNPNEPERTLEQRLDDIDRQLERIRQQLDYVIAFLRSDDNDEEKSDTLVVGEAMREFEEADALKTEKAFEKWCESEKTKGRPQGELTFQNFMKETVIEPKQ